MESSKLYKTPYIPPKLFVYGDARTITQGNFEENYFSIARKRRKPKRRKRCIGASCFS